MTVRDLKNILRYYDEDAEVKVIVNTDDVHYNYGFYRENTQALCETEEEYDPERNNGDLIIRAEITDSVKVC